MNFIKGRQEPMSPEAAAFGARLNAIAARGRADVVAPESNDEPMTEPQVQRRSWSPDQAPVEDCGE